MYCITNMNRCARADEAEAVMIPAGDVCAVLDGVGDVGDIPAVESSSLPQTHITEQVYTYGFSPVEALEQGTMFPELVN